MLSSTKGCCLQRVVSEERETCYQSQSVAVSNELCQKREKHVINHKALLSLTCCCDKGERNMLSSTKCCCRRYQAQRVVTEERETCYEAQALLSPTSCYRRERNMLSSTQHCCLQRVVTEEREICYQSQSVVVSNELCQKREKRVIKHKALLSPTCCCDK